MAASSDTTAAIIVKPADCEVRSVIRFLWSKRIKPAEIHREVCSVYGGNIMSDSAVRKWCRLFRDGRTNVHDEERSGRPTVVTGDLFEKINEKIREDRKFTITELSECFPQISRTLLYETVTQKLQHIKKHSRQKGFMRWLPSQVAKFTFGTEKLVPRRSMESADIQKEVSSLDQVNIKTELSDVHEDVCSLDPANIKTELSDVLEDVCSFDPANIKTELSDVLEDVCSFDPANIKVEHSDVHEDVCSLDLASNIKIDPVDVRDRVCSPAAASVMKRELDIEPEVRQPPDNCYMPLPCKPDHELDTHPSPDPKDANPDHNHEHPHTGDHARIDKIMYNCEYCMKSFSLRRYLVKHVIRIHNGKQQLKCDTSKNKFSQKYHKSIPGRERPFSCECCDMTFVYSSDLSRHKLIHTGERPFSCDSCSKTFSHRLSLYKHKMVHTGERPFNCDSCNKTFTYSSDLSRHNMIHTGERPFSCEFCEKAFSTSSSLSRHSRTHTGERPFSCGRCNKTFSDGSALKRHKSIHT